MPETSIIKAEDRYSSVLKNMSNVTKAFDKESEHLEGTLQAMRRRSWRTAEGRARRPKGLFGFPEEESKRTTQTENAPSMKNLLKELTR